MSTLTLAGITLPPDLNWSDEFTGWKVGQTVKVSLTGAQIVQESALQAGRPVTLESQQDGGRWVAVISLATLRQLQALEEVAGAAPMSLVLPAHNSGTRTLSVIWRRASGSALEAKPIKFISPPVDGDWFSVTLRLMTV